MDCNSAKKYFKLIISENFSSEINEQNYHAFNEHINKCYICENKYVIDSNIKQNIKKHYSSVLASDLLKEKISRNIKANIIKPYRFKIQYIASCLAVMIGLGLFADQIIFKLPHAHEIHNTENYHLVSDKVELVLEHVGLPLKKYHFESLERADFKPQGTIKIEKPFNKKVTSVALKNTKGQKLTLCLYPENYKLPHKDITHIEGTKIYHGSTDTHNFAFWEKQNMTLVLISDSILPTQLAQLAQPIIE